MCVAIDQARHHKPIAEVDYLGVACGWIIDNVTVLDHDLAARGGTATGPIENLARANDCGHACKPAGVVTLDDR
jgi:hypothetical protein